MATLTLPDAFNLFCDDLRYGAGRTQKTVNSYQQAYKAFQSSVEHATTAEQILMALKAAVIRYQKENTLSKNSINVYLRAWNSFFTWLHKNGYAEKRLKFDLLKVEQKTTPHLTDEEILKFRNFKPSSLSQRRAWTAAMVVLDTGARINEVLNIHREDIDFDNTILTIRKGKGQKQRRVPFSEALRSILFRYIRECSTEDTPIVFSTDSGTAVSYRNLDRDLKVIGRKLGVHLRYHMLRHTYGTYYIRTNGNPAKLQRILGHATITTTQKYIHMQTEDLKDDHAEHSPLASVAQAQRKR